jgi:ribonuclease Z
MSFSITIIGSSSATPTRLRSPSAQLFNIDEHYSLIDCGEGTQMKLINLGIKFNKIDNIFISHLHGDHYLGLPGLLFSMHLFGRTKPLNLFGPLELKNILDVIFKASDSILLYNIEFYPLVYEKSDIILKNEKFYVKSFPLSHGLPAWGFKFEETEKERKIQKSFLLGNNDISIDDIKNIKQGADYVNKDGTIFKNSEITIQPLKPVTYAYCSDTVYYEKIISEIYNVDLLYHESTFMSDMQKNAIEKHHSTSIDAANIAKQANAGNLLIGHFSARYKNINPLLDEARSIFANTFSAEEGYCYSIIEGRKLKIIESKTKKEKNL